MPDITELQHDAERLREVVVDLHYSKEREQQLRRQSEALLMGLQYLNASEDTANAFETLLRDLNPVLQFDDAFILLAEPKRGWLTTLTSTNPRYEGRHWQLDRSFTRCLTGKPVIVLDCGALPSWPTPTPGSAIYIPLRTKQTEALLVGVKSERAFFNQTHLRMALKLMPLAQQALINLEKKERLQTALAKIELLFDHLPQGILTVGQALTVNPECSCYLATLFEQPLMALRGQPLLSLLLPEQQPGDCQYDELQALLSLLMGEDELTWLLNHEHLPEQLHITINGVDKVLQLLWSPVYVEDEIEQIMLSIRDVTEQHQLKEQLDQEKRQHQQMMALLDQLIRVDRQRLGAFFQETQRRMERLAEAFQRGEERHILLGELHTLKGAARSLGLTALARQLHQSETELKAMATLEASLCQSLWLKLSQAYDAYYRVYNEVFTGAGAPQETPSLLALLEPHLKMVRTTLHQRGIALKELRVADQLFELPKKQREVVDTVALHTLTNMVDHSITPCSEDPTYSAAITIQAQRYGAGWRLRFSDNGRGFNVAKIKVMARRRGLAVDAADPLAVLFEPGFSTAAQVTETSGRGIGLWVVRDQVAAAGGEITLSNGPNGGSQTAVTLPLAADLAAVERAPSIACLAPE